MKGLRKAKNRKAKTRFVALILVFFMAAGFVSVFAPLSAEAAVTVTTPYKVGDIGKERYAGGLTFDATATWKSISTPHATSLSKLTLQGSNGVDKAVDAFCLNVGLRFSSGTYSYCQGSVASVFGSTKAAVLNGLAGYFMNETSIGRDFRRVSTQLAIWYYLETGKTDFSTNANFEADMMTMLYGYFYTNPSGGQQQLIQEYKKVVGATGVTDDQLLSWMNENPKDNTVLRGLAKAYGKKLTTYATGNGSGSVQTAIWSTSRSNYQALMTVGSTFTSFQRPKIKIQKTDQDGSPLAGAKFKVYNSTLGETDYLTTDANGYAETEDNKIKYGDYVVTETVFPAGYKDNGTTEWKFTLNESSYTITLNVVNIKDSGAIGVYKTDDTGKALSGVVFNIYSDSACTSLVGTMTTGSDGKATKADLSADKTYYVREKAAPAGHVYNSKVYSVKVVSNTTTYINSGNAVVNTRQGKFTIYKTDPAGSLGAGYEFTVYSDAACTATVTTLTTGEDGSVTSGWLAPGTYYVKETALPAADTTHEINTEVFTVAVTAGDTSGSITVENALRPGSIRIIKQTNTTGTEAGGWGFQIYDAEGNLVKAVTTVYDIDFRYGMVIASDLEPGTYTVKEIMKAGISESQAIYWDMAEPQTVTVKPGQTATVTFTNRYTGLVEVTKTATNGGSVEGWEFTFTDTSGNVVFVGTTDADGKLAAHLEPGTYYVQETNTDKQYWVCDTSRKTVTVTAGKTVTVSFANQYTGELKIKKTATNGGTVEGWKFELRQEANMIGTFLTDENGEILITGIKPGTYRVTELKQYPSGAGEAEYWELPRYQNITIEAGKTAEVTFENQWKGKLQVTKTMKSGGPVSGWQFEVRDSSGVLVTTLTTGEDGTAASDLLEPGTYTVTELFEENSLYYCKVDNPQTVTVTAGATATASFVNAARPGKIIINKVDNTGNHLAGAKFLLEWSSDGGATWTPVSFNAGSYVVSGGCMSADLAADGTLTTGEDGIIEFSGLHPGLTYRVTELEAPEGYVLLSDYAFVGTLPVGELTAEFTVVNSPGYELPGTGVDTMDTTVMVGLILVAAVSLFSIGLILFKSKRKKEI